MTHQRLLNWRLKVRLRKKRRNIAISRSTPQFTKRQQEELWHRIDKDLHWRLFQGITQGIFDKPPSLTELTQYCYDLVLEKAKEVGWILRRNRKEEENAFRNELRNKWKSLVTETYKVRERLRRLKREVAYRESIELITGVSMPIKRYPIPVDSNHSDIPEKPGVYFGWSNGRISYIGQSWKLRSRVTQSHEKLRFCSHVSLELTALEDRWYRESLWIGLLRPELNGRNNLAREDGDK